QPVGPVLRRARASLRRMGNGPERRRGGTVQLHHAERVRRHAQLLRSAERSREAGGHVAIDGGTEDSRVAGLRRERSALHYMGRGRERRRSHRDDRAVPTREGGGYSNSIHYTHSSTLRTVEEIFGVSPLLGDASQATDLADLFVAFP